MTTTGPTLRLLSLGAGVQSTALAILAARGDLPGLDGAIFSDTGWEPRSVYEHLDRLDREVLQPAGIPLYLVSSGNVRDDALDPAHRFASMPLFVEGPCRSCDATGEVADFRFPPDANPKSKAVKRLARWLGVTPEVLLTGTTADGVFVGSVPAYTGKCPTCQGTGREIGIGRRQCTSEYKLKPIKRQVRLLLGARWSGVVCRHTSLEWGCANCHGTGLDAEIGQPPRGRWAEQWIGFSVDESHRALDAKSAAYSRSRFPLLERRLSRADCQAINIAAGFPDVAKSACIGCPYHRNRQWRELRDQRPAEWADAVDFDHRIRGGSARANFLGQPLRGQMYLHEAMVPLDQAPIDRVTRRELLDRQGDILAELSALHVAMALDDDTEVVGCGPFACRVTGDPDDTLEAIA